MWGSERVSLSVKKIDNSQDQANYIQDTKRLNVHEFGFCLNIFTWRNKDRTAQNTIMHIMVYQKISETIVIVSRCED